MRRMDIIHDGPPAYPATVLDLVRGAVAKLEAIQAGGPDTIETRSAIVHDLNWALSGLPIIKSDLDHPGCGSRVQLHPSGGWSWGLFFDGVFRSCCTGYHDPHEAIDEMLAAMSEESDCREGCPGCHICHPGPNLFVLKTCDKSFGPGGDGAPDTGCWAPVSKLRRWEK